MPEVTVIHGGSIKIRNVAVSPRWLRLSGTNRTIGSVLFEGLLKSQNTILQTCYALFTYSHELVQLCYKYNVDVGLALCCSGAMFAAICNDFSRVIFSQQ